MCTLIQISPVESLLDFKRRERRRNARLSSVNIPKAAKAQAINDPASGAEIEIEMRTDGEFDSVCISLHSDGATLSVSALNGHQLKIRITVDYDVQCASEINKK